MKAIRQARNIITPPRPSLSQLLIFWLIVFLIPVMSAKLMFNLYAAKASENAFLEDTRLLHNELELFKNDMRLENVIVQSINENKKTIMSEIPDLISNSSLNQFSRAIAESLGSLSDCPPELVITLSEKTGISGFYRSNDSSFSPGRRSSQIIVAGVGVRDFAQKLNDEKRFNQIVNSTFGDLIEFPEKPATIKTGFTSKRIPEKVFSYFDYFSNPASDRLKVFFMFSEKRFSLHKIALRAISMAPKTVRREIHLLKTIPERDFIRTSDHRIYLASSIPSAILRTGSHSRSSWYNKAIDSGFAYTRPGKMPFAVVSKKSGRNSVEALKHADTFNLALLLLAFFGLFLMQQTAVQRIPGNSLNTRFRLAIFASTFLPFTLFLLATQQFSSHFASVTLRNRSHFLRNELLMAETNIKNNDIKHREKINRKIKNLKKLRCSDPTELKKVFDQALDELYVGYTFIRSDGVLIEQLPSRDISSSFDYHKFILARELILAHSYKIFLETGKILPESEANFEKIPGFVKWQAFRHHFTDVDTNNFLLQEGKFLPSSQADSSHFMISTYKFWPENTEDKIAGFLMLTTDRKKVYRRFLNKMAEKPVFVKRQYNAITHLAIFSGHDNSLHEIDSEIAWPLSALEDTQMLKAAKRVNSKETQAEWSTTDENGITQIFSARALIDLPVKLVARSEITRLATQKFALLATIPVIIIYCMILVYLISYLLSQKFIKPALLMLDGVESLKSNCYPFLSYNTQDEFGGLINEFNSMVRSMKQRHLLERFISQEVTQAIVDEATGMKEEITEQVDRAVMFIHIRNFSVLIEQIPAESAIKLLNVYFSSFEQQIKASGGQIDKYIGDAIMTSFSDEGQNIKAEIACVNAALKCLAALPGVNQRLQALSLPTIKTGFGIASGSVIRGRIGSRKGRQDFTLIGDTVNLAARLEAASHFDQNNNILVAESVVKNLPPTFSYRFFKDMKVKGKAISIKTFIVEEANDD